MTVTAIRQDAPDRPVIVLDDGEEIQSTPGAVTALRLFVGRELDLEELEAGRLESRRALARERALTMISRRRRSAERGLLDEEAYAAAVVRHYAAKGFGAGKVRAELARRGVPRSLADAALEAMPEGDDKLDRLIAARLKDPGDRGEVRKLSASLYRRGFSGEEIRSALRRAQADDEEY